MAHMTAGNGWVADRYGKRLSVEHLDGVPWYEAPIPSRLHHCWAQTRALDEGVRIERCPCAAIRLDGDGWVERNNRKPRNVEERARVSRWLRSEFVFAFFSVTTLLLWPHSQLAAILSMTAAVVAFAVWLSRGEGSRRA